MKQREIRSLKVRELRATKTDDGKQYLEGRAASYNVLSDDMGGWRERIMPGAFTRALNEKQDVRHLLNHKPYPVLGRTSAGTLELTEGTDGLHFRTLLSDSFIAEFPSFVEGVERRDINECSFGFVALDTNWVEEQDASSKRNRPIVIRELRDLELLDISTVTYPAYPETKTQVSSRATSIEAPSDAPAEFRSKMAKRSASCDCQCAECVDGDCAGCSNEGCTDEECRCSDMRAARSASAWKTKAEMRLNIAKVLQ